MDVEIANHCYNAIIKSGVKFNNINYRKALLYLAINMHKTDQRTSPPVESHAEENKWRRGETGGHSQP